MYKHYVRRVFISKVHMSFYDLIVDITIREMNGMSHLECTYLDVHMSFSSEFDTLEEELLKSQASPFYGTDTNDVRVRSLRLNPKFGLF